MGGIQVIKTAFSFLFKVKLFQLLLWLDFESTNEKKIEGEAQKKGGRVLQDRGITSVSRKQFVKQPAVSQGRRSVSSLFCNSVIC